VKNNPSLRLGRDLLIQAIGNQLQEHTRGGTSRTLRRQLQILAREFQKGGASCGPGPMLKTGTTLVHQWRGDAHTVVVREDSSNMRVSVIARCP
jgi:Protein of unknown function (DUF2924)